MNKPYLRDANDPENKNKKAVIKTLENWLEKAKQGELSSFIGVAASTGGRFRWTMVGEYLHIRMIGQLRFLEHKLMHEYDDESDDDDDEEG